MTDAGALVDVRHLKTLRAVRERCEAIHRMAERGVLAHWRIDDARLDAVAERVARTTRAAYRDIRAIPDHSRWRHFSAGGVDRAGALAERLLAFDEEERLAARCDLAVVSVVLDAGAGDTWRYRDARGDTYARSEGIAVASYELFVTGAFSNDAAAPLRADADGLERATASWLGRAFQVDEHNPMVGIDGRALLLQRLGRAVRAAHGAGGRIGDLGIALRRAAMEQGGELPVTTVFDAVRDALGSIWPGREVYEGENLGDVWAHSLAGRVPFHKLSQWLTYSLVEPLTWAGVSVVGMGELTGLAEYRNGGLFVDDGALVPVHAGVLRDEHDVWSDVIIEWRALTVALLDRIAPRVRAVLGLSEAELPLAKVLEGGTWRAGRELAAEMRADGGSPLHVRRDGTVF